MTRRIATLVALAAVAVPAVQAQAATMGPVETMKDAKLGEILSTHGKMALYIWKTEKPGTVKCVGQCAKVWPPLIVRSKKAVPAKVDHVMGKFGTIKRPDGRLQVTYNSRPLYTYHDDPKGVAKCNNVDNWFVVKVM